MTVSRAVSLWRLTSCLPSPLAASKTWRYDSSSSSSTQTHIASPVGHGQHIPACLDFFTFILLWWELQSFKPPSWQSILLCQIWFDLGLNNCVFIFDDSPLSFVAETTAPQTSAVALALLTPPWACLLTCLYQVVAWFIPSCCRGTPVTERHRKEFVEKGAALKQNEFVPNSSRNGTKPRIQVVRVL